MDATRTRYASADGTRIAYDDRGPDAGPVLLCLPGWCVDRGFFAPLAERLAARRRIVTMDWRGHGDSERPRGDVGHEELVADALAVVEACGARSVVPVAQAHGGWVALELRRRLGERVPAVVTMSWLVLDPPPPFLDVLGALQDPARWQQARDALFAMWTTGAPPAVAERVRTAMGAYGFDTWSRAGQAIGAEYQRHGSPLRAAAAMRPLPRLLHVYSQPPAPEFLAAQQDYGKTRPWFSVRRLEAVSHFPSLEIPDVVAGAIEEFAPPL